MTALLVAVAGAAGVLARYGIATALPGAGAILAVNVAGSFALGALVGAGTGDQVRTVLGLGFLGGFTTYSTFAVQAWERVDGGDLAAAFWLVAGSVVLGVGAAGLGIALGRAV
ncbi:CrcB family protein [Conexibacter sp. SYSU D00693]|uniref:fluoride efflux transporter FluC n=1 Tax=Conexibacter sp. SYSU D00693 TaxID=2812560 RepID=UPI00196A9DB3|nr:CrcB family protein [Conexibacter sp. SYSU D00693]